MARSPWNFFARLTGRRSKVQEASREGVTISSAKAPDQIAFLPPPISESGVESDPDNSEADQTLPSVDEAEVDGDDVQAPVVEVKPELRVDPPAPAPDTRQHELPQAGRRAARPAKVGVRRKKQAVVHDVSAGAPLPSSSVDDEALKVENEIQELRRQLAKKLQSQNAQLKRMLNRFGG